MAKSRPDSGAPIADVAAVVGDPTRANMLSLMMDGRAHSATELASSAEVTAATASGHLGKLLNSGLVEVARRGRHRYYRLATQEVAGMLEGIMVIAAIQRTTRTQPRIPPQLREARTCYDHIAGRLGVTIAHSLIAREAVSFADGGGEITHSGFALLRRIGIDLDVLSGTSRRALCRPCLDWSERQPHIAGVLGKALLQRLLELSWIERIPQSRAVSISRAGGREMARVFGWRPVAHAGHEFGGLRKGT